MGTPAPAAPAGNVELELLLTNPSASLSSSNASGSPVPGATVHGCSRLDFDCASPFGETVTDDGGEAFLTEPGGFDGYLEVKASGFSPSILAREPQLRSERSIQGIAFLPALTAAAPIASVTQEPDLTIAIVTVFDCNTAPAAGVEIDVGNPGPNEQVVYLASVLPSPSAKATDGVTGSAIIFNVPPGTLALSASFASDGRAIRTLTTLARTGWVTLAQLRLDQASYSAP
jgi:hypothetical protein